MNNNLRDIWKKEEQFAFEGWDFSHLNGRFYEEKLPWDYREVIYNYLSEADVLLDMGTGGGEFLLTLNHPYNKTHITESYLPNIELCREKLIPLGVGVHPTPGTSKLPFENEYFDIIINRHEEFDIKEVSRILKPDGVFITQQVGGQNNIALSNLLIDNFKAKFSDWNVENAIKDINVNNLNILYAKESYPKLRFFDTGAVVYFAKIIEWEFPNFSVDTHYEKLLSLNSYINKMKYFESTEHRFIIVARKQ